MFMHKILSLRSCSKQFLFSFFLRSISQHMRECFSVPIKRIKSKKFSNALFYWLKSCFLSQIPQTGLVDFFISCLPLGTKPKWPDLVSVSPSGLNDVGY